ncbi:MAG: hypothetical protein ABSA77_01990 [Thermoguttaceae bacterium]|jgi:hypothetical protein
MQMNFFKKTESGLYYGNVDGTVGKLLSRYFQQLPTFRSAIVISIDSSRAPADLVSILRQYKILAHVEAAGVVLTPDQLYNAACRGVFESFDEVLLLDKVRPEQEVSLKSSLSSDLGGLIKLIPAVEAEMKAAGCILALADGINLSYATWDGDFAKLIESEFG